MYSQFYARMIANFGQQRLGRKTLLTLSTTGAILSLAGVGIGLNTGMVVLASLTILTFVA